MVFVFTKFLWTPVKSPLNLHTNQTVHVKFSLYALYLLINSLLLTAISNFTIHFVADKPFEFVCCFNIYVHTTESESKSNKIIYTIQCDVCTVRYYTMNVWQLRWMDMWPVVLCTNSTYGRLCRTFIVYGLDFVLLLLSLLSLCVCECVLCMWDVSKTAWYLDWIRRVLFVMCMLNRDKWMGKVTVWQLVCKRRLAAVVSMYCEERCMVLTQ